METYNVATRVRRRTTAALFAGAAAINAAITVAGTAATLVVADRAGTGWGGIGSAAAVAGTAGGVWALSRVTARRGRRTALLAGVAIGTAGAALATAGAARASIPVLLAGMLLLGVGNGAGQLARYAAAELYPPARRATALGAVVWAGTVGAVGGPLLLASVSRLAGRAGWPPLSGAFAFAMACLLLAVAAFALVTRRPAGADDAVPAGAWPLRRLLARPDIRLALVAMMVAQVVMVGVMSAGPLHLHEHGRSMGLVGLVVSVHTLGMFGLAPLSGRLADRFGGRTVVGAGLAVLVVAAALVTGTAASSGAGLAVALFLLGYGWDLVFVGCSALLVRGLPGAVEARVQGLVEGWTQAGGGAATVASTAVLGAAGYPSLAVGAGMLVLVPAALLAADHARGPASAQVTAPDLAPVERPQVSAVDGS